MGFWKKHWGWFIDISSLGVVRRNFPRFEFLKWRLQKTYQPPFLHPLPAKVQTENRHRFSHLGHMLCGQERASCATVWVTITKPLLLWESWVPSLGWEDPLEKGKATHSGILAGRIPRTVQPMGLQRVRHDWMTSVPSCAFLLGFPLISVATLE